MFSNFPTGACGLRFISIVTKHSAVCGIIFSVSQNCGEKTSPLCRLVTIEQRCGPREHLIWPPSEISLPNLEYKIASERSSSQNRCLDGMSRESLIPQLDKCSIFGLNQLFLRPASDNPPFLWSLIVNRFPIPAIKQ